MKKVLCVALAVMVLGVTALGMLIAGCGGEEEIGADDELIAVISDFGNENFLPWRGTGGVGPLTATVYDMLVYWDEVNKEFIPGLAESWELSEDGMILTYHIREGVQFQDDWGELTAEDVKWNFEQQALPDSTGKVAQVRYIDSMEVPDPYTLIVDFKTPSPTFLAEFSTAAGATAQGIACKKYVEEVGEAEAAKNPIGSGPYKLVDSQLGSYYTFEAVDEHWRVVPEFKLLTVRMVTEPSTVVAMLKTGEVDCALTSADQLEGLEAAGVNTEVSPVGGSIICMAFGGMAVPEDSRYDPDYHNKDPWALDERVRKAMTISIDRQAIIEGIFKGAAIEVGVFIPGPGEDEFFHYYDPEEAKQLLVDAGYPDGFSFKLISYIQEGVNELPDVVAAVAEYWKAIGLDPQIENADFSAYGTNKRHPLETAGEITGWRHLEAADQLTRCKIFLIPEAPAQIFMDEGSVAIINEGLKELDPAKRLDYVYELNKYYYEHYGPVPICRAAMCYAWSDKMSEWPHCALVTPLLLGVRAQG